MHWRNHLSHTQELILQATKQCSWHNSVVVLGSGLLLDVPVEQLSQRFKKVMLVDVVQLRSVRHRCQKLASVTLLEHDITGLAESLLAYRRHDPLPTPNANLPDAAQNSDLIISCNLLSQLPLTPSQRLQQHHGIDQNQLTPWCTAVLQNHLSLLAEQTGNCGLISDIKHHYLNEKGSQLACHDMLLGLSLGSPDQQWQWTIAPLGELSKHCQLHATVQGFYNWSPITD